MINTYAQTTSFLEVYVVVRAAEVIGSAHLQAVAGADGVRGAEVTAAG